MKLARRAVSACVVAICGSFPGLVTATAPVSASAADLNQLLVPIGQLVVPLTSVGNPFIAPAAGALETTLSLLSVPGISLLDAGLLSPLSGGVSLLLSLGGPLTQSIPNPLGGQAVSLPGL